MEITNKELLEKYGWSLDCENPLEISHTDGSRASNIPAKLMIESLKEDYKEELEEFRRKNSKVISPDEILLEEQIPEFVIQAVNNLLKLKFMGGEAYIYQDDIMKEALKLCPDPEITRQDIFNNKWMDFEPLFENNGWSVRYDKPGYNESYRANFTFTKKKK